MLYETLAGALTPGCVTFKCTPPMLFRVGKEQDKIPGSRSTFTQYELVTACSFQPDEHFPYGRTVLHATERLQGDEGFCYGGMGSWTLDGVKDPFEAMSLQGYANAAAQSAKKA